MRISIWQQFSANHSSNFDIIGRFESTEAAVDAAKQIQERMDRIAQEQSDLGYVANQDNRLVPAEKQLIADYNLPTWDDSLDFVHWLRIWNYQNNVLIKNIQGDVTKLSPEPLIDFLRQFTHEVTCAHEYGPWVTFDLQCTAPVESFAKRMVLEFNTILDLQDFETHQHPVYTRKRMNEAQASGDVAEAERLAEQTKQQEATLARLTEEAGRWKRQIPFEIEWQCFIQQSEAKRHKSGMEYDGTRLKFNQVDLIGVDEFEKMLIWLTEKGCADIRFQFTEEGEF